MEKVLAIGRVQDSCLCLTLFAHLNKRFALFLLVILVAVHKISLLNYDDSRYLVDGG